MHCKLLISFHPFFTKYYIFGRGINDFHSYFSANCWIIHLPEKVAAEDEAQHEDEEADAQDDDIDVEREVVDVRRHAAVVFRAMETQTTKASCQEENKCLSLRSVYETDTFFTCEPF